MPQAGGNASGRRAMPQAEERVRLLACSASSSARSAADVSSSLGRLAPPRFAGSRPARRAWSVKRYSIWALMLRRSSSAQRLSASNRSGLSRRRKRLLSAIVSSYPLGVERTGVEHRGWSMIHREDDHEVRDHRGLTLGIEVEQV